MTDTWREVKPMDIPEDAIRQTLEDEQSTLDKLSTFVQRSPFLVAGLVGLTSVCGYGVYKWKTTKYEKPSLFFIQLRVAAQATTIGCIALGMIYNMYNDFISRKKK